MGNKLVYNHAFGAVISAHASSALHDLNEQHKHAQVFVHSSSYTGFA